MFGYVVINRPEMKIKDFDEYRAYYCGLCKQLQKSHGRLGQISLSFDCTFLVLLLSALYEPEETKTVEHCIVHPLEKHQVIRNRYTEYVADMDIILAYYNCLDDWEDERKLSKGLYSGLISHRVKKALKSYPEKAEAIRNSLTELSELEKKGEKSIDLVAGCFGRLMGEIFAFEKDVWSEGLRRFGFFLGKFIYILDAFEDLDEDIKKGSYNPFAYMDQHDGPEFDSYVKTLLTMMIAECSREFERLPILKNVDILRNILYSGVWTRYDLTLQKRKEITDD